jgi:CBS domain-containing protein
MVGDCMSKDPIACFPEDDIQDAEKLMKKHQIRHIPVVDHNGCCIGLMADI